MKCFWWRQGVTHVCSGKKLSAKKRGTVICSVEETSRAGERKFKTRKVVFWWMPLNDKFGKAPNSLTFERHWLERYSEKTAFAAWIIYSDLQGYFPTVNETGKTQKAFLAAEVRISLNNFPKNTRGMTCVVVANVKTKDGEFIAMDDIVRRTIRNSHGNGEKFCTRPLSSNFKYWELYLNVNLIELDVSHGGLSSASVLDRAVVPLIVTIRFRVWNVTCVTRKRLGKRSRDVACPPQKNKSDSTGTAKDITLRVTHYHTGPQTLPIENEWHWREWSRQRATEIQQTNNAQRVT